MTFRVPNILSSDIYVQWKKDRSKSVSPVFYVKRSVIFTSPPYPGLGHSWSFWVILWVYHMIILWTRMNLTSFDWFGSVMILWGWGRNLVFLQSRNKPKQNQFRQQRNVFHNMHTHKIIYISLKKYKDFLKLTYESFSTPHLCHKTTDYCLNSFFLLSYHFLVTSLI